MYSISLVNMPFAAAYRPSLALTQLQSVVTETFGERVSTRIHYLNQDFAVFMGIALYQDIAEGPHYNFGLGDWFFRQIAFREQLTDNTEEYWRRYYPYRDDRTQAFKRTIEEKRRNLDLFFDALIDRYELDRADLVGLASVFSQNVASFALARKLKERKPSIVIIMGGANCEAPMGKAIARRVEHVDFVFSGPALQSFPELVRHLLSGDSASCQAIDGVFSKANCTQPSERADHGRLLMPRESRPIRDIGNDLDIDADIPLDYGRFLDALETHFPDGSVRPSLLLETSRGCWWGERAHCTFCGLNGLTMNFRAMAPLKALEQFRSMFRYADRCSSIECIDNIMPRHYLREVLPFLETPPTMSIFYELKANLTESDVQTLARARVKVIQPGIEALATSTLELMKKGVTAFQNIVLLKNCTRFAVYPVWNLLVGFPGEDEEVYRKYVLDLPRLTHLPPPTGVYPVRFDRYSPYFAQRERFGLDLHPCDFYELTYPFSPDTLDQIAYYFMDYNYGADYIVKMLRWLPRLRQKHEFWRKRWHGKDQIQHPKLHFVRRGAATCIYDSRTGDERVYEITAAERQALEVLAQPVKAADLRAALGHVPDVDPERIIAVLRERGLVFEERERLISLVLPEDPPAMNVGLATPWILDTLRDGDS